MRFKVTLVKVHQTEIETEAGCHMDALKYVQLNAQLGQYQNLDWKEKELYGTYVEEIQ